MPNWQRWKNKRTFMGIRVRKYGSGWCTVHWWQTEDRQFSEKEWTLSYSSDLRNHSIISCYAESADSVKTPSNWTLL